MHYLARLLLIVAVLAEPAYARTASDMIGLPPYCAGRFARDTNPAEYKRWEARYGPDFLHTHHLCDGIIALNKIPRAKNSAEKRTLVNEALGNLDYMIRHANPDFALMPEVYLYRGQVYGLLGRTGEAIADLRKVIALDPKRVNAYLQAAHYLERIGKKDEALKLVSEGLRHLPDAASLRERYLGLGGKEPYPQPYADIEAKRQETAPAEAAKGGKLAIFDLRRLLRGASNVWGEAGAYYLVELTQGEKDPADQLRIRLSSTIPQPSTRVARIGIDMGRYQHLFTHLQVKDAVLGQYYPMKRVDGAFQHAFWPGFNTTYMAAFTIDPKEGKMYDPRAIAPGSSLTMVASLAPGVRYEDVLLAMQEGLHSPSGVRVAIILHHTRGYRPDPSKTIMDDGGFVTGTLRHLQGVAAKAEAASSTTHALDKPALLNQATAPTAAAAAEESKREATKEEVMPAQRTPANNPWCRFCPVE